MNAHTAQKQFEDRIDALQQLRPPEPMWSKEQVAAYFGVAQYTIDRWVNAGWLHPVHIGPKKRLLRFHADEIRKLVADGDRVA